MVNSKSDTTHVLSIDTVKLSEKEKLLIGLKQGSQVMPLYFYDFGGQDFYHGLYRAFTKSYGFHLLLFNKNSNQNEFTPDVENRNQINHSINFWLGEKNYLENSPNPYFVVQTHEDETIYLDYHDFENLPKQVFHVSTQQNERKLQYLWESLLESIEWKEEKGQKTFDFYSRIYANAANDAELRIYKIEENYLKRAEKVLYFAKDTEADVFMAFLRELNRAGVIFLDEDKKIVFGNPEKLINEIHSQVLTANFIGNGKIGKTALMNKIKQVSEEYANEIIGFLEKQKTAFFDEESAQYIFPNFLPLFEDDPEKDFFDLDKNSLLFAIQFKHFIPFGMINQLVCHFGKQPNKKRFWRDRIFFNLYENNEKKATVSVVLDVINLKIKVYGHILKEVEEVKEYLFESILAMYWQKEQEDIVDRFQPMYTSDYGETGSGSNLIRKAILKDYELPKDSQLSLDDEYFIDAAVFQSRISQEEIPVQLVLKNAKNQDKIVPTFAFSLFTIREIKKMKKMKKIFISYSRQDMKFKDELKTHLSLFARYGVAKAWSCDEMKAGEWHQQIQQELEEADIIVYMISANFMDSDYIMEDEVRKGMALVENNPKKKIICVLVRECSWRLWKTLEEKYPDSINTVSMNLTEYQFHPYHQFKKNSDEMSEKIVALEQWGREGYEMRSVAYTNIANAIFKEI